jgi:DNA repair exonuclease SbcCD ATPase subunit
VSDLIFDRLTVRNFLRYGDRPTTIDISGRRGLVVIRGENGHGKSSVFDALSFALTGKPMRQFPMGALVNNVNKKKLEVTVDLRKGPWTARISRGQKPGFVRFWKKPTSDPRDVELEEFSETAGRGATDTAKLIEDFLGFDNALFCSMIAGSTRRPSFLASDSSAQKAIVERLFGFSVLQDDAAAVKAKREVEAVELSKLRSDSDHRERQLGIVEQKVAELTAQSRAWSERKVARIDALEAELSSLMSIDVESARELELVLLAWDGRVAAASESLRLAVSSLSSARLSHQRAASRAEVADANVASGPSDEELALGLEAIDALSQMEADHASAVVASSEVLGRLRAAESSIKSLEVQLSRISDVCDTCGQPWPDAESRRKTIAGLESELASSKERAESLRAEHSSAKISTAGLDAELREVRSALPWPTREKVEEARRRRDAAAADAVTAREELKIAAAELGEAEERARTLQEAMAEFDARPSPPDLAGFARVSDLENRIAKIASEVESMGSEADPYTSGIEALQSSVPDPVDVEHLSSLIARDQAARALERLLTHKDSPLRAAILARFLPTLNDRVTGYLDHLGLPYAVRFTSDLEVQILDGEDEVSALSGGEEERLAMALSWSFRDIYEEIHGVRVCFSAIDERLDSGMDAKGADAAVDLLRRASLGNGRSVWLVTHRPELESHADHVLWVRRNNRFSEVTG